MYFEFLMLSLDLKHSFIQYILCFLKSLCTITPLLEGEKSAACCPLLLKKVTGEVDHI